MELKCFPLGGVWASLGPKWALDASWDFRSAVCMSKAGTHPGVALPTQTASTTSGLPPLVVCYGVLWETQVSQTGKWGSLAPGTAHSLNCFVMKHFSFSEQSNFDANYSIGVFHSWTCKIKVISVCQCSKINVEYWHFSQDQNCAFQLREEPRFRQWSICGLAS